MTLPRLRSQVIRRHPLRSKISPSKNLGGCARRAGGVDAATLVISFFISVLWCVAACPYWLDPLGSEQLGDLSISVIKRDIGRKTWAGTIPGHGEYWTNRYPNLRGAPVIAHGKLLLSAAMKKWRYDSARDLDQRLVERLRRFPREPDMLVYGLRSLVALIISTVGCALTIA